jgi:hypothetical protein
VIACSSHSCFKLEETANVGVKSIHDPISFRVASDVVVLNLVGEYEIKEIRAFLIHQLDKLRP